jgi:isopenicillin-N epimerase
VVYLDHGAYGACPRPVLQRQRDLREHLESHPVEFLGRRLPEALEAAREQVAAYVGVAEPAQLVFLPNTTTAINAVARSAPLGAGDEVVVTDREYGAMLLVWEEVARRTGARIVTARVPVPACDEAELVEAVWAAVSERTRMIFFSHITSETALVLPVAELCRRAREAGIWSVVDGAHAPGQIELALDRLGADCYAGNCHKWLCAPKGAAFLYASGRAEDWLGPPVVSWGWTWETVDAYQSRFSWSGTDDPTAILSVPEAIRYQHARAWPELRERCRDLARRTQTEVLDRFGGRRLASPDLQAPQMVAFPVPHADPERLQRELLDRFRIEVPAHRVNGQAVVRLSVQAYTSEEDCGRLIEALTQAATSH